MFRLLRSGVIFFFLGVVITMTTVSCRQAKYVPDGQYLLKSNEIAFNYVNEESVWVVEETFEGIDESEMLDFVRPEPNKKAKLFLYNRVDSTNYQRQIEKRVKKNTKKNEKFKAEENEINQKRIAKAKEKGLDQYKHKTIEPKPVKLGFRNTIRNKMGQAPVLTDTFKIRKSGEQLDIYMRKQGYFGASVVDTVIYDERKKKAFVRYVVTPGNPYIIRAITFDSIPANKTHIRHYQGYLKQDSPKLKIGDPLVEARLDYDRERYTHYCRNKAGYFGFDKNYVSYKVDTTLGNYGVSIQIFIKDKYLPHPTIPDSSIKVPHQTYKIKSVTFNLHNPDAISFRNYQAYQERLKILGLDSMVNNKFRLLDTVNLDIKGKYLFNEKPFIRPELIDFQNFLEVNKYYEDYYVERTYGTLVKLDVFSTVTTHIELDPLAPQSPFVHIKYDLVPGKKQSFLLEPRAANTNGVLGINGTVSYTNRNLVRGAQRLKISFTGSIEAQPAIAPTDTISSATGLERLSQVINTFEWAPVVQLRFPKLWPLPAVIIRNMSKRSYPSTNVYTTVNFQQRAEFARQLAELSHEWSFKVEQTQEFKFNFINFKYVRLVKDPGFIASLNAINDPGLINSYSDHFTTLVSGTFHYNNTNSENRRHVGRQMDEQKRKRLDVIHDFLLTVTESGGVIDLMGVGKGNLDTNNLRTFLGIPFTQFVKIESQYVYKFKLTKRHDVVYRLVAGFGSAYRNSPSMPYEQSFFAGGSNDIRAFVAKSMAPGGTRKYEDLTLTRTQIGDIKLEANIEWRFDMTDWIEGALFVDAGNIWMLANDSTSTSDSTVFRWKTFPSQMALGGGFGIRADLDFLIVRIDLAMPLYNPYLPSGERWITDPHTTFFNWHDVDGNGKIETGTGDHDWSRPFSPKIVFGIGYPF